MSVDRPGQEHGEGSSHNTEIPGGVGTRVPQSAVVAALVGVEKSTYTRTVSQFRDENRKNVSPEVLAIMGAEDAKRQARVLHGLETGAESKALNAIEAARVDKSVKAGFAPWLAKGIQSGKLHPKADKVSAEVFKELVQDHRQQLAEQRARVKHNEAIRTARERILDPDHMPANRSDRVHALTFAEIMSRRDEDRVIRSSDVPDKLPTATQKWLNEPGASHRLPPKDTDRLPPSEWSAIAGATRGGDGGALPAEGGSKTWAQRLTERKALAEMSNSVLGGASARLFGSSSQYGLMDNPRFGNENFNRFATRLPLTGSDTMLTGERPITERVHDEAGARRAKQQDIWDTLFYYDPSTGEHLPSPEAERALDAINNS